MLATLLEPARRKLYRYVVRESAPVSRDQAATAIGASRAAAAHHLDKLVEAGLLRVSYRRLTEKTGPGAGRPSKLYRRSRRRFDISLPERNYELLARLLAQSADIMRSKSPAEETAHEYGRLLGLRARKRLPETASPARLAKCAADVLDDLGFESAPEGPTRLVARNCPFEPLSRLYENAVCHTGLALTRGIVSGLGAGRLQAGRDYRPDRCCIVVESVGQSPPVADF